MGLVLITGMPLEPHSCVCCGGGPRDADNEIVEAVFAEGVDINWGDSVYICKVCSQVIAELWGFTSPDDTEKLKATIKSLEDYEERFNNLNEKVRKMLEGARARKDVKDSA